MLTFIGLMTTATAGPMRQPVLDLLNTHDQAAPPEAFQKLGDGVPTELMEIAVDTEIPHSRRARAVSALGHFVSDESHQFLTRQLATDDALLKRKAAWALATGWGDAAIPLLQPLLENDDVQLRMATAKAIGTVGTPVARTTLERRLGVETDPHVLDALKKGMRTPENTPKGAPVE